MKHYFILIASMLLSDIGCYGQQVTTDAVTVERLHAQVRNLEQTVMKLLSKIEEMKTTKSGKIIFFPKMSISVHVGHFSADC